MTAPNTPTPELVERLRKEIPYNADGCRELRDLADEAATAIAKLTAERDALRDAGADEQMNNIHLRRDLEAAEKRVKELGAKLKRITAIGEDNLEKLKSYIDATPAIEASNKRLTERVAVLETALEPFCADLFNDFCPDETPAWYFDDEDNTPSPVTVGDLRRALAAREAK